MIVVILNRKVKLGEERKKERMEGGFYAWG